jgi:hypothetical protein
MSDMLTEQQNQGNKKTINKPSQVCLCPHQNQARNLRTLIRQELLMPKFIVVFLKLHGEVSGILEGYANRNSVCSARPPMPCHILH